MLMDKDHPSRGTQTVGLSLFFVILAAATSGSAITLSHADALRIGKKVWQNECNGTISGLTSWNAGENFASLGIGHFIWYPKGQRGPFEESFPKLVAYISGRGAKLPKLLLGTGELPCPWNSRIEFARDQQTPEALHAFQKAEMDRWWPIIKASNLRAE